MLSFYKWVNRLLQVSEVVYGGCEVHRGNESYSSKMCGWCNRINENLGGERTFKCPFEDCIFSRITVDRDGAAARNIDMLSHLHGAFPYPSHAVWSKTIYKEFVPDGTAASTTVDVVDHDEEEEEGVLEDT